MSYLCYILARLKNLFADISRTSTSQCSRCLSREDECAFLPEVELENSVAEVNEAEGGEKKETKMFECVF